MILGRVRAGMQEESRRQATANKQFLKATPESGVFGYGSMVSVMIGQELTLIQPERLREIRHVLSLGTSSNEIQLAAGKGHHDARLHRNMLWELRKHSKAPTLPEPPCKGHGVLVTMETPYPTFRS